MILMFRAVSDDATHLFKIKLLQTGINELEND